nr:PREDICTED: uncharacterized protein LOC107076912 isoform X1 [Lepisosteus oculatus]
MRDLHSLQKPTMPRKHGRLAIWKQRRRESQAVENEVVLTKMNLYRNFGTLMEMWESRPPLDRKEGGVPSAVGGGRAVGVLSKSESEDSGVEMPSTETTPSTPRGSECSFSLTGSTDPTDTEKEGSPSPLPHSPLRRPPSVSDEDPEDIFAPARSRVEQALRRTDWRGRKGPCARLSPVPSLREAEAAGETADAQQCPLSGRLSQSCVGLEYLDACWRGEVVDSGVATEAALQGSGLGYLEQVCRMLEEMAKLQKTSQVLQRERKRVESKLRARGSQEEGLCSDDACGTAEDCLETLKTDPRKRGSSESSREEPFVPTHFRQRSVSESQKFLQNRKPLDQCDLPLQYFHSTGNLLEIKDTLPEIPAKQTERKQLGKVKELVSRLKRKSLKQRGSLYSSAADLSRKDAPDPTETGSKRRLSTFFKKREKNLTIH